MYEEITCPICGASELHPDGNKLLIRANKIQSHDGKWRSHCLVCAGWYDEALNEKPYDFRGRPHGYNPLNGWF